MSVAKSKNSNTRRNRLRLFASLKRSKNYTRTLKKEAKGEDNYNHFKRDANTETNLDALFEPAKWLHNTKVAARKTKVAARKTKKGVAKAAGPVDHEATEMVLEE